LATNHLSQSCWCIFSLHLLCLCFYLNQIVKEHL
jgi:hypothetical protein